MGGSAVGGGRGATSRRAGAMGGARARPGPISSGLRIRAPTETGSPRGPKREWPLGHRRNRPRAGATSVASGNAKSEASAEQRPTERPVAAPSATRAKLGKFAAARCRPSATMRGQPVRSGGVALSYVRFIEERNGQNVV